MGNSLWIKILLYIQQMTLIATFFALLVKVCRDLGTSLTGGNPLHLDVKLTKSPINREFGFFYTMHNEVKRGKKSILAGQCTVCLKS